MANSGIVEIQMPQMGESVTEGTVLEWHKQEGEFVEEGETVVEVSTDKVDAEVPAPASGVDHQDPRRADETIEVGGALAELDPSGSAVRRRRPRRRRGSRAAADRLVRREPATETRTCRRTDPPTPRGARARRKRQAEAEASGGAVGQIVMPEMGESVTEGTVLEWH